MRFPGTCACHRRPLSRGGQMVAHRADSDLPSTIYHQRRTGKRLLGNERPARDHSRPQRYLSAGSNRAFRRPLPNLPSISPKAAHAKGYRHSACNLDLRSCPWTVLIGEEMCTTDTSSLRVLCRRKVKPGSEAYPGDSQKGRECLIEGIMSPRSIVSFAGGGDTAATATHRLATLPHHSWEIAHTCADAPFLPTFACQK